MDKLIECPFCGAIPIIQSSFCGSFVVCRENPNCQAQGRLSGKKEKAINAWNTRKAQSEWVSVESGELPENGTWVLIYVYQEFVKESIVAMAFFEVNGDDEQFWLSSTNEGGDGWEDVTHWQPLPKGPSE